MSRFPTAGHLSPGPGLCPRNDESAGKRRSTRLRQGAPWLKTTLVQCAWAAARKKGSYLQAQFHRLAAAAAPRRRSARSPPPSSPPPTTCSGRHLLPGPRRRPLRRAPQRKPRPNARQAPRQPGLRRRNQADRGGPLSLLLSRPRWEGGRAGPRSRPRSLRRAPGWHPCRSVGASGRGRRAAARGGRRAEARTAGAAARRGPSPRSARRTSGAQAASQPVGRPSRASSSATSPA